MRLLELDFLDVRLGCLHQYLLPSNVNRIFARQLVEHAVAANDYEVVVVLDFKCGHVGIGNDHVRVALVLLDLGFDIADGTRDGKPTRENSVRTIHHLLALLVCCVVVLDDLRVLVDSTSMIYNSLHLDLVRRLVIS